MLRSSCPAVRLDSESLNGAGKAECFVAPCTLDCSWVYSCAMRVLNAQHLWAVLSAMPRCKQPRSCVWTRFRPVSVTRASRLH